MNNSFIHCDKLGSIIYSIKKKKKNTLMTDLPIISDTVFVSDYEMVNNKNI